MRLVAEIGFQSSSMEVIRCFYMLLFAFCSNAGLSRFFGCLHWTVCLEKDFLFIGFPLSRRSVKFFNTFDVHLPSFIVFFEGQVSQYLDTAILGWA